MRNNVVFFLALATVAPLVSAQPAFAQSSFTGNYAAKTDDGPMALSLSQKEDGSVTGTLSDGETELELRGRVVEPGKKVAAKVYIKGQEVPITCEIRREGAQLRFTMLVQGDKTDIVFTRKGGAPEADAPGKPQPKAPSTPAKPGRKPGAPAPVTSAAPATGAAFRHPTGISFRLPEGWKVMEAGIFYALLPPGQSKPADDEAYLLVISQGNGSEETRLAQGMEILIMGENGKGGALSNAERTGRAAGGATYEGDAQNGKRFYARTVVSSPDNVVIGILAMGVKTKIQPREKALLSLVSSVKVGSPERDERFYGTWSGGVSNSGIDARDSAGSLKASSTSDSSTTFTFSPNGVYTQTTTSRTIAIGAGVSLDSGDTVEKTQLTWAAADGKVSFITPTGIAVTGTYRFQGNALVVSVAGKTYVVRK